MPLQMPTQQWCIQKERLWRGSGCGDTCNTNDHCAFIMPKSLSPLCVFGVSQLPSNRNALLVLVLLILQRSLWHEKHTTHKNSAPQPLHTLCLSIPHTPLLLWWIKWLLTFPFHAVSFVPHAMYITQLCFWCYDHSNTTMTTCLCFSTCTHFPHTFLTQWLKTNKLYMTLHHTLTKQSEHWIREENDCISDEWSLKKSQQTKTHLKMRSEGCVGWLHDYTL